MKLPSPRQSIWLLVTCTLILVGLALQMEREDALGRGLIMIFGLPIPAALWIAGLIGFMADGRKRGPPSD